MRNDSAAIADPSTAELPRHILGAGSDVFVSGVDDQNLRCRKGIGECETRYALSLCVPDYNLASLLRGSSSSFHPIAIVWASVILDLNTSVAGGFAFAWLADPGAAADPSQGRE